MVTNWRADDRERTAWTGKALQKDLEGQGMRLAKVESIDAHVGKRLRQRRIELGMSQQKLSGVTGVSYQQIQKYGRGTNRIGASMLWLLSDVLNIQPAY